MVTTANAIQLEIRYTVLRYIFMNDKLWDTISWFCANLNYIKLVNQADGIDLLGVILSWNFASYSTVNMAHSLLPFVVCFVYNTYLIRPRLSQHYSSLDENNLTSETTLYEYGKCTSYIHKILASQRRHNERHGVSNHWQLDCLLNRLFKRRSKAPGR